ncbi:MAG: penicillin-binding protein 2 [Rhodobacteraceae bacterium]|nr:penicillin-binding protein 2 [Paracoccaceae bacterium]
MISNAAVTPKMIGKSRSRASKASSAAKAGPAKGRAARKPASKAAPPPVRLVDPAKRARRRMALVALVFLASMAAVATRFADLATRDQGLTAAAPQSGGGNSQAARARASILDRNGLTLAADIRTYELYLDAAQLHFADEREEALHALSGLFPDFNPEAVRERTHRGKTVLIKRPISPAAAQAAHNLGIPGVYYVPRVDRVYPAGRDMAHLLGWTNLQNTGMAGLELGMEGRLSVEGAAALELSVDLRVQRAALESLNAGMARTGASAGAAVVLNARNGEIRAMASLPDYNPIDRPAPPAANAPQEASPLFNHAAQGRYELGSTFKMFTWALALEQTPSVKDKVFDPPKPLEVDKHVIRDSHPFYQKLSFQDAFAKSSNVIAAQLALDAGRPAQKKLFNALGLHEPTGVELGEARRAAPVWNEYWSDSATAATAFGHGVAATPLHLAAAMAAIVNGGVRVRPTLLKRDPQADDSEELQIRAISPRTSHQMRDLLRYVVTNGTGKAADAPGFQVGGKTGTANKPKPGGGYYDDKVLATFAAAFPMGAPEYVVVVMLDEPVDMSTGKPRRGAGATAAPVVKDMIPKIAPLLGVPMQLEARAPLKRPEAETQ